MLDREAISSQQHLNVYVLPLFLLQSTYERKTIKKQAESTAACVLGLSSF